MQDVQSEQDLQDAIALKIFDGDESALRDILVHYGPRTERALLKRFPGVVSVEDIEEILSDALRKLWSMRARYDDKKKSVRGWFYLIANSRTKDVLRLGWKKAKLRERDVESDFLEAQYMEERHVGAAVPDDPPTPEAITRRNKAVWDTLAELPDQQRRILEHDALAEEEVDSAELGRRLGGVPAGTVRVYRLRGRESFQKGMKKRGYDVVWPTEECDAQGTP